LNKVTYPHDSWWDDRLNLIYFSLRCKGGCSSSQLSTWQFGLSRCRDIWFDVIASIPWKQKKMFFQYLKKWIQSNVWTMATLGTQKTGRCSKVFIFQRLVLKNYYQYWTAGNHTGFCRQVAVVQRRSLTQVWLLIISNH
jgi:hypothetical protein